MWSAAACRRFVTAELVQSGGEASLATQKREQAPALQITRRRRCVCRAFYLFARLLPTCFSVICEDSATTVWTTATNLVKQNLSAWRLKVCVSEGREDPSLIQS